MNISKTDIDALNSVIQITVDRKDYDGKVSSVLNDYRKKTDLTSQSEPASTGNISKYDLND